MPIGSECVIIDLMVETKMVCIEGRGPRRLIQGGGVSLER